jgi:hypothetical protein
MKKIAKVPTVTDGHPFHLPPKTWELVQACQAETHPDIPLDPFSIDIVTGQTHIKTKRGDPRCPSGMRFVEFDVETYITVTITGKFIKDPSVECSYQTNWQATVTPTKARVKAGTYKEGECVPKPT